MSDEHVVFADGTTVSPQEVMMLAKVPAKGDKTMKGVWLALGPGMKINSIPVSYTHLTLPTKA